MTVDDLKTAPAPRKRRHLPGPERERQIVEAATRFFAEHGFEGQTRELAKRMGITHSAIFRYFPTKEALIERVYHQVFLERWNPDWESMICDRTRPLEDRLMQFYSEYSDRVFNYEWLRILYFAALKGIDITPRYIGLLRDVLILPVCGEVRAEIGLAPPGMLPFTEREVEAVWALHSKIIYIAIRRYVYNMPMPEDVSAIIADDIFMFMRGAPDLFRIIHHEAGSGPS